MANIKDRYRRFKEWEQQPHDVAPLSQDEHECATCGTHFVGNYCPRCGQSARIGRYSFKKALLLFLDVWGIGNRGMFRTLRDLILRPGYMIRDYLRGMQMAYFPPFKMFFLLFALLLLIQSGLNIQGLNYYDLQQKEAERIGQNVAKRILDEENATEAKERKTETRDKTAADKKLDNRLDQVKAEANRIDTKLEEWLDSHASFLELFILLLFSCPLWLLIRHCPAIPDLRLSECIVAMVYISNMFYLYSIIPTFMCFSLKALTVFNMLVMLLIIIPIKQLTGYNYWQTIWRIAVATIPFCCMFFALLFVGYIILYLYVFIKFI